MTNVKLYYDGWLALPATVRRRLALKNGDRLALEVIDGGIVLRPETEIAAVVEEAEMESKTAETPEVTKKTTTASKPAATKKPAAANKTPAASKPATTAKKASTASKSTAAKKTATAKNAATASKPTA
ncbi:MAG: AbrB/MazE/SpoVT family DNA-binding domain-containing protein, partial [Cyanobacteria bacterium J06638_22]